jgi:hypothetical protein
LDGRATEVGQQPSATGLEGCSSRVYRAGTPGQPSRMVPTKMAEDHQGQKCISRGTPFRDHAKINVPTVRKSKDGQGARWFRPL